MQGFADTQPQKNFRGSLHIRTRIDQRHTPDPHPSRILQTLGGSVHVLVTADTMSGAWTYTRELVTGLVTRGIRGTLVTFGESPLPDQTACTDLLNGLAQRPTP